ncbi:MAG: hypothetical protein ACRERU_08175 [Methylococcales bacterium]
MDTNTLLVVGILLLGMIALIGFFKTKTEGFGKYNTSTLVLLVVLFLCSMLFASGRMESQLFANVVLAIIGFAGGLVVAREK